MRYEPEQIFRSYRVLVIAERELMIPEGMNPSLADSLIQEAEELPGGRAHGRQQHAVLANPDQILTRMHQIQRQACDLAFSLEQRREAQGQIQTIVKTGGGLAIIAFNAGSWALNMGLGAPVAAISCALGSALVLR